VTRADETQQLWLEYRRTGDEKLRDGLILTYEPLVNYVAGRLCSGLLAHVNEGNLISWGLRGLNDAIDGYDPTRDVQFETYAIAGIKRQVIDELKSTDWDDSYEGGGGAGVREPRRPLPHAPSAEDAVDPAA